MTRKRCASVAVAVGFVIIGTLFSCRSPSSEDRREEPHETNRITIKGGDNPPVVCRAIEQDDARRTNNPDELTIPVDLVVLAVCRPITDTEDRHELEIKETLYGSPPAKSVLIREYWDSNDGKPRIFALMSRIYDEDYEVKYRLDADEEKSQLALAAARLDFHVLSSCRIFVGREIATNDEYLHTVEVVRSLAGAPMDAGKAILVRNDGYPRTANVTPAARKREMLYLVGSIVSGRDIGLLPSKYDCETIYRLNTRLPGDMESAVREAMGRRASYPIIQVEEDGKSTRCREILFRGSAAEAIEMMGSTSHAAVTLAARALLHRGNEASGAVAAAIDRDLLNQTSDDPAAFRRLRNLAQLISPRKMEHIDIDPRPFVRKLMAHISTDPPEPPSVSRNDAYYRSEEFETDVNHALAWLLAAMKPENVMSEFGSALIALRDGARGKWKSEVQLALDVCRVEETSELSAAMAKSKDIQPLRIASDTRPTGERVAFSHNGRMLAVGSTVWNIADWSPVATTESKGIMFFSPDDRYLYVLGGGGVRLDLRSGDRKEFFGEHTGEITSADVSADGFLAMTASFYDDTVRLWSLPDGNLTKTFDLPRDCFDAAMCSDGETFVIQTGKFQLTAISSSGRKSATMTIKSEEDDSWGSIGEISGFICAPDGMFLVVTTFDFRNAGIRLYALKDGLKEVAVCSWRGERCTGLAVSPDSRHLVVADQKERVRALSLPDLKVVRTLPRCETMSINDCDMAFSPDGGILAIGLYDDTVRLFDGRTFDAILPPSGHGGRATAVHFSSDGRTIRSIGKDFSVCQWDAITGKMTSRLTMPAGFEILSVREDGRFLVCHGTSEVGDAFKNPARIVDADTGAIVCEVTLPTDRFRTSICWIDDRRAVVTTLEQIVVFDYRLGEKISEISHNRSDIGNGMGKITEDGGSFFVIDGGGRMSWVETRKVDILTGQVTEIGKQRLKSLYPFRG